MAKKSNQDKKLKSIKKNHDSIDLSVPISKAEPAYIRIEESQTNSTKSRLLWIIVGIFGIFLIFFWLILLKSDLEKKSTGMGFSQIATEISESLSRFDTEINGRSDIKTINADELASIKNVLENKIKSNPDSSVWPSREFSTLNLSLRAPADWSYSTDIKNKSVIVKSSTSSEAGDFAEINISVKANSKKSGLKDWINSSAISTEGYSLIEPIWPNSTSSVESIVYQKLGLPDTELEKIVFMASVDKKSVNYISVKSKGDIDFYGPILNAIIRSFTSIK